MHDELPSDVHEEIKQRVASGQYSSEEDVPRDAMRDAMRAPRVQDEEVAAIQAGIDDMEAGRLRPFEEVDAEIRGEFGFSENR